MLMLNNKWIISKREDVAGLSIILFFVFALLDIAWNANKLEKSTLGVLMFVAMNNWIYILFICYELIVFWRNWDTSVEIWAYQVTWFLPIIGILLFGLSLYLSQLPQFMFVMISTHLVWPILTIIDLLLYIGLWRRDERL